MKAHTVSHGRQDAHARAYRRLGLMALLSFATMYLLMCAMVDRWANVYGSFNQVFMAGLMTAPMVVIEAAPRLSAAWARRPRWTWSKID